MLSLIITLIIIGVLLYLVNTIIPMDGKIKTIINVVVIVAVCLWLLEGFGLFGANSTTFGHFHSHFSQLVSSHNKDIAA